jgi:hypothetical protein
MAIKRYAIVKMDDFEKTKSTGGVVIMIRYDKEDGVYGVDIPYTIPEGCQRILCTNENVKEGWIYTDKTNIFVDSNYSTNT